MKRILLTGASGFLGRNLLAALSDSNECSVIASATSKDRIPDLPRVERISNDELLEMDSFNADVVVNCAFARGNNVSKLISALYFNEKLIQKIKEFEIGTIINISSQGIYKSQVPGYFGDENAEIEPKEMYAMAKFAQERLFASNFGDKVTNIRLASLSSNARFLVFFVESVIAGKEITVTAPDQYVSLIDVTDAVHGIERIMNLDAFRRAPVYNLGTEKQYSILELAELTNEIGSKFGYERVGIHIEDSGKEAAVGMDCSRLRRDTGWNAMVEIEDMIKAIYELHRETA